MHSWILGKTADRGISPAADRGRLALLKVLAGTFMVVGLTVVGNGSAYAAAGQSSWQYGWDQFIGPLNFTSSNVAWSQTNGSTLDFTYNFIGATPNATFNNMGIALLYSAQSQCQTSFGQFALGPCFDVTRQGVTSWEDDTNGVLPPGVGTLTTDGSGNGSLHVVVTGIAAGSYKLEFYATGCGCEPGGIDFQSPGPFGTGINLTFSGANQPTSKDQCKNDGWVNYTDNAGNSFKNQGDCVSFVATGGKAS